MAEDNNQQLELFSETGNPGINDREAKASFLKRLWNYEKIILSVLCLLTTAIVSFSLGVEKGKRPSLNAVKNIPAKAYERAAAPLRQEHGIKPEAAKEETNQPLYFQGFTIQLASYHSRPTAEKEALALKKRGLSPLVLNKGSYIVLCVGNFSDKTQAESLMPQLRQRYADCRIRRL